MEIRSLKVDFDNNILEINGKPYKKKTTVLLPASEGWKFSKLFNGNENNSGEKSDRLEIELMDQETRSEQEEMNHYTDLIVRDEELDEEFDIDQDIINEMRIERAYRQGFRQAISITVSVCSLLVSLAVLLWKLWILLKLI